MSIACTAKGADATAKNIAIRFRIVKGRSILATSEHEAAKGKVKATLKIKKALKKGKYTLRIAISHAGGVTGITRTVKL